MPVVPFAPSRDVAVSAVPYRLRFGAFCWGDIPSTKLGDGERNEIGLGDPSGVTDRFIREAEAGEEASRIMGIFAVAKWGILPPCSACRPR
jgi:hypothetical protein